MTRFNRMKTWRRKPDLITATQREAIETLREQGKITDAELAELGDLEKISQQKAANVIAIANGTLKVYRLQDRLHEAQGEI